jgi:hypothetical protein
MHGGQVVQQIGLEEYFYVKNQTGTTILNGTVTYASGTLGTSGRILADLMVADGTIPYFFTLGITTEDIVDGDDGYVTQFGLVRGINTTGSNGETWVDGDILYVSPTVPGTLTKFEPEAPNLRLQMAIVIKAATNGSLFVRPNLGSDVGSLHDVLDTTTTSSYGDILVKSGSIWTTSKQLTGSYGLTGSLTATSFTGSLQGTSSWAANAVTSSYVLNSVSSSFASTASFVNPLVQDVIITGSLVVSASGTTNDFQVGSNKLFVSASGRVGIGTSSPSSSLHVNSQAQPSTGESIARFTVSDADGVLAITNNGTADGTYQPTIVAQQASTVNTTGFLIRSQIGADTGGSYAMIFEARSGSASVVSTRPLFQWRNNTTPYMVMDATGSVGIGTTNPLTKLNIIGDTGLRVGRTSGGDTQYIDINHNISSAGTPAITSFSPTNNAKTLIINATTDALSSPASAGNVGITLLTYGTGSLWVDSKQFVGVGIAVPTAKLHVTNTSPSASFLVEDSTNPDSSPFVIDNAGNVGIGTQTPTAKLDVSGSLSITGSISLTNILTLQGINPLPSATNGSISFSSSGDFYFASGSAWHKLTL